MKMLKVLHTSITFSKTLIKSSHYSFMNFIPVFYFVNLLWRILFLAFEKIGIRHFFSAFGDDTVYDKFVVFYVRAFDDYARLGHGVSKWSIKEKVSSGPNVISADFSEVCFSIVREIYFSVSFFYFFAKCRFTMVLFFFLYKLSAFFS